MDSNHAVKSVAMDNFYKRLNMDQNYDFMDVVKRDLEPNEQYLRYWHGSMIILRPLLTVLNAEQIYLLNKIVMWLLAIVLLVLLFIKSKKLAIMYIIAMIMIAFPFVPFCFEYSWMFYLMFITSIIAISIEKKGNDKLYILFFITGMLTCFFDFLSTEIITILVPIILVTYIRKEKNRLGTPKETFIFILKSILLWGIAYCSMWLAKWIIASIVLKTNAIKEYVIDNAMLRVNGLQGLRSYKELYLGGLFRNWHTLFPINIVKKDIELIKIGIGFLIICVLLIDWKNIKKKWYAGMIAIIGILPYIRYLVLANHSYRHFFFTFRSQIVTILAIQIILVECFNKKLWLKKVNLRKNKKRK